MAERREAPARTLTVRVRESVTVSALKVSPVGDAGWTFIYAPGAGANLQDPFGRRLCAALGDHGVTAVRFQFPYMEAGRRSPDRPDVLEATWRAVIEALRPKTGKLAVGGRSMGGRIGSMVHAAGIPVDALALFAYPLHPPGRPEAMRTEHFASIKARTLFVSGTSDAFASPDELRDAARMVKRSRVHLMHAADHGFNAPKSSGRTRDQIYDEATSVLINWLRV